MALPPPIKAITDMLQEAVLLYGPQDCLPRQRMRKGVSPGAYKTDGSICVSEFTGDRRLLGGCGAVEGEHKSQAIKNPPEAGFRDSD